MDNSSVKLALIFGRQKDLSLAEAQALFDVVDFGNSGCVIETDQNPSEIISQLGGTTKIAEIVGNLSSSNLEKRFVDAILNKSGVQNIKVVGISDYAEYFKSQVDLHNMLYKIKKRMKIPVRYVENFPELTTVQVTKNKIIEQGAELVLFKGSKENFLAITRAVQDFEEYSKRDYGKPCRPDEIGMFPPKLAQIMINLTSRLVPESYLTAPLVLDPFCGSGTVVSEALLMGFKALGSDISDDMVSCARKNMVFTVKEYNLGHIRNPDELIFKADAGKISLKDSSVDFIVTEGTLGKMWKSLPQDSEINEDFRTIEEIHAKFLPESFRILKEGGRLGITIPQIGDKSPKIIDKAASLGYSIIRTESDPLIYKRSGQIVGRKILILEK